MNTKTKKLSELTHVVRSKNAGPFEITLDMIFLNKEIYEKVKETQIITKELIADLYSIPEEEIVAFAYFDAANAIKATIVRPRPQASIGETDMHACQQHAPLLQIEIPWE